MVAVTHLRAARACVSMYLSSRTPDTYVELLLIFPSAADARSIRIKVNLEGFNEFRSLGYSPRRVVDQVQTVPNY